MVGKKKYLEKKALGVNGHANTYRQNILTNKLPLQNVDQILLLYPSAFADSYSNTSIVWVYKETVNWR